MKITKEDIIDIIHPASTSKFFNAGKASYLSQQVEEAAKKILELIKNSNDPQTK